MSISVKIVTENRLDKKVVLDNFSGYYSLMDFSVIDNVWKLAVYMRSSRGVEVTEEDYGYEVNIKFFSNRADYDLWKRIVYILKTLADAEVYNEDDEVIEDISETYNDKRVNEIMCRDYKMLKVMINYHNGEPVCIPGVFRSAYIGKWLLRHLDINNISDKHAAVILHQWFNDLNWETYICEKEGTNADMKLKENGSEETKRISVYEYEDWNTDYSYVTPAELFAIVHKKTGDTVLIEYDNIEKVIPECWERIDDRQYAVCPLTPGEFNDFIERARKYDVSSKYKKPFDNVVLRDFMY